MNRNLIRIACVLDKSGSMKSTQENPTLRETTISSFNNFVNDLKADSHGQCQLKLIQFDTNYEVIFDKPLQSVPALTSKLYSPGDNATALLDAQGRTIDELGVELRNLPETERAGKVIVVTITDGLENSSKHYTHGQVSEMIEHQQKIYGWDFIYLGANQDAVKVGGSLNIPRYRSMTYNVADPKAMAATYSATAHAVNAIRSHAVTGQGTGNIGFTEQERTAAAGNTNTATTTTTTTQGEPAVSSR